MPRRIREISGHHYGDDSYERDYRRDRYDRDDMYERRMKDSRGRFKRDDDEYDRDYDSYERRGRYRRSGDESLVEAHTEIAKAIDNAAAEEKPYLMELVKIAKSMEHLLEKHHEMDSEHHRDVDDWESEYHRRGRSTRSYPRAYTRVRGYDRRR